MKSPDAISRGLNKIRVSLEEKKSSLKAQFDDEMKAIDAELAAINDAQAFLKNYVSFVKQEKPE